MAEQSGFFDAHLVDGEYDRVYLAESFAKYFASFIGNGIFAGKSNELMVQQKEQADMSVRVLSGQGWINGYWYENTEELSLAIDNADGVLNRIDSIVLRWSNSERVIRLAVKKGTPASVPSVPHIQRDADIYELKLADVYVKAGTTRITQASITDKRLSNSVCGFVAGVVQQFDTKSFGAQINSFIEEFKTSNTEKMNEVLLDLMNIIEESDITHIGIEDTNYPGCYYRMRDGEKEWINPPMELGVEYRTTERWSGKALYQKTIGIASLPDKSVAYVNTNTSFLNILFMDGFIYNATNGQFSSFPVYLEGRSMPSAVINKMDPNGYILLTTFENMSAYNAEITIKYTKQQEGVES